MPANDAQNVIEALLNTYEIPREQLQILLRKDRDAESLNAMEFDANGISLAFKA